MDHAFDSLKAISAYCPSEQINSSAMPNKFHAKNRFINHNKPSNKTSNYGKSGNTTQYPHPQCVANQAQQRTNSWILTKMYHSNININNAASSKNESSEQKVYSRTTPGLSKFPTHNNQPSTDKVGNPICFKCGENWLHKGLPKTPIQA